MNFLDESGLKKLWTKIKASFDTALVESSQNPNIPFVANHQIVNVNRSGNINVYDWFQKASKGGILEVFFAGAQGGETYCNNGNISYLYKMQGTSHGLDMVNIGVLKTDYNTYARLIKTDDEILVVATFVQNK
jgi:coenzyme F420-reducing hydrogenase delta subunit